MALRVNGQTIDDAQIDQEFDQIKACFEQQGNVSCCERNDEFQQMARENLIGRILVAQHASQTMPEVPAEEVEAALAEMQKQQGGPEMLCMAYGLSIDQLDVIRDELRTRLQMQKLLVHLAAAEPEPDDSCLREHYMKYLDRFTEPDRVRAWHILKSVDRVEKKQEIFEELCRVRRQLLGGADFYELAEKHSDKAAQAEAAKESGDHPEEGDGIDLGWFALGDLAEEFSMVAFSMKTGEISPVFSTQFGLHLVKLVERQESRPRPFGSIRKEVREDWAQELQKTCLKNLITDLTGKADIQEV